MIYKENLKKIRERTGITQVELANVLNITKARYCQCETEYEIFPLKHLNTLCNYFDVSIDYIFGFSNNKKYDNYTSEIDLIKAGERLKTFRKELKLTQEKLALKLNIARSIVSKYEKGEFLIATHTLYSICKKYNISADYLLGKIDNT